MRNMNNRDNRFSVWWFWLTLLLIPATASAQAPALQLGVLPTLSPRVLLTSYHPLQAYLEHELRRPVEITTATNFRTFYDNTLEGKYDVVVTAAHLARLAQTEAKYIPLACYQAANRAMLLEAKDRPLTTIQDLRGKMLAIPDRHALIVSQVLDWLAQQGLHAGADFGLLETPSHSSAAYSVIHHLSALSVSSPSGFKQMTGGIKAGIEVFTTLPELPSLIWLANPRIASEAPRLKAALLGFSSSSAEGAQFFAATGYIGMREVTNQEMRVLEPYAREIKNVFRAEKAE